MTDVVIEEVVPETQVDKTTNKATLGLVFGFIVMLTLNLRLWVNE